VSAPAPDERPAAAPAGRGGGAIERAFERVLGVVRLVLGALVLGSIALNGANIVGRYLFGHTIVWAEETMIYVMVWLVFVGAPLVAWDNAHLRMDALSGAAPRPVRRFLNAIGLVAVVGASAFVAWNAWHVVELMGRLGRRSVAGDIPMTVPHGAILIGFVLLILAVLIRWRRVVDGATPPPVDGLTPVDRP
jgi:TRAP-type C4-dicarboxylate transport system permease small subunit